ncbi:recombinase family protein [Streptomyces sp. NPDC053493]|uniref:recombinase family protein n=1 Tax=Streptomyces sp. NPDC053493 TaxID=3365705 RepID=UPI0037CF478B
MDDVRVAAIASLTPLEELDDDPFLVDTRSQHAMCVRWARARGYVVTRQLFCYGIRPDHDALWADVEEGAVDLFVAPNERVLARALTDVTEFFAECERRGVRLETAGFDEPAYDAPMKAGVHRRLSMPTAGYDGC